MNNAEHLISYNLYVWGENTFSKFLKARFRLGKKNQNNTND